MESMDEVLIHKTIGFRISQRVTITIGIYMCLDIARMIFSSLPDHSPKVSYIHTYVHTYVLMCISRKWVWRAFRNIDRYKDILHH